MIFGKVFSNKKDTLDLSFKGIQTGVNEVK